MTAFEQAEQYINEIPRFAGKNTVEDTSRLLTIAGCDRLPFPVIHVAGTNGKGSVCACLASILKESGRRVGIFTSPHLVDIRERIRIDDEMISEDRFAEVFREVQILAEEGKEEGLSHPSFFEYLFLMAMIYFRDEKPDAVILETGLGGRLDATNSVKHPALCVITEIGFDHMQYLGNTLEEIAGEKAGIIKKGVPVIFPDRRPETTRVLVNRAKEIGSRAVLLEKSNILDINTGNKNIDFSLHTGYYNYIGLSLHMVALYQVENASLAVLAAEELNREGYLIGEEAIRKGLLGAYWPGRMEEVQPGIFLDGAHNEDGIEALLATVKALPCRGERKLLFGVVADKQYEKMIRRIAESGLFTEIAVTTLSSDRSASLTELSKLWRQYELPCRFYEDAGEAFGWLLAGRKEADVIYVAGSLYLIGQIKSLKRRTPDDRF